MKQQCQIASFLYIYFILVKCTPKYIVFCIFFLIEIFINILQAQYMKAHQIYN